MAPVPMTSQAKPRDSAHPNPCFAGPCRDERLQLVVFWVHTRRCALDILRVREIQRFPGGPGTTLTDLHAHFGFPPGERTEASRIVIVETDGSAVGLIADRVEEVLWVDRSAIDSPTALGGPSIVPGTVSSEGRITLLDPDALPIGRSRITGSTERRAA